MSSIRSALPTLRPSSAGGRLRSSSFSPAAAGVTAARRQLACGLGLSASSPEISVNSFIEFVNHTAESSSFEHRLFGIDARGRIVAMRHGKRIPRLNRPPDQRKALLRGLTTQLLKHGRIKTTKPRAKAMRKYVDKMITLAKDGSLHKRRQALAFIYEKHVVHAMFAEVAERYLSGQLLRSCLRLSQWRLGTGIQTKTKGASFVARELRDNDGVVSRLKLLQNGSMAFLRFSPP
ncbi:hypothetical protein PR202_gb10497 [Eleusine coracana subsp. coracana]|uniref:50S ribosomal protein L17, chloroplastic n=1 Tax=Eleusine coracana subsp. coracana TaxID=191504 RepID=A0AAV5EJG7_ELECO|nr:hypothetical protein PR202_gb10497 [Eleusine coracana subsp. coracana]